MEKKEFKVGEVFDAGLVRLKCVDAPEQHLGCEGCIFNDHITCGFGRCSRRPCNHVEREDGKDVIFIKAD